MNVLWGYVPPEVRASLRPVLVDFLWLLPPWCLSLYVAWDERPEDGGTTAYVDAQPEYRQAQLRICPGWLSAVTQSRRQQVAHELIHVGLAPMAKEHDEIMERLMGDGEAPKFHAYAKEQWRRALEGSVQDMAKAVARLPGPFPSVGFTETEDDDVPQELVRVHPRYFGHLRELERVAIDEGRTTPTAWEAP